MKCSKCGENIPSGAKECPACRSPAPAGRESARVVRFDDGPPLDAVAPEAAIPVAEEEGEPLPAQPLGEALVKAQKEERIPTQFLGGEEAKEVPPEKVERSGIPETLGPYKVEGLIGRGGMGAVYKGFDDNLKRHAAIKILAAEHARSSELVRRFLGEARAIAKLSHQNVVAVHYAGTEGGLNFFAMEFVDGESLQDLVSRQGPLPVRQAVDYVLQAARGLAAACEEGMIHRDVKPANLMLTADDEVKVADFGLAKMTAQMGLTKAGEVAGSPYYMSPEQGRGENVDHRADIYSLGATLFYLLTSKHPFEADDAVAVLYKHCHNPLPKIPNAPYGLERLLQIMMSKDPGERHADYGRLIADLERLHERGLPAGTLVDPDWQVPDTSGDTPGTSDLGAEARAATQRREKVERLLQSLGEILEVPEEP